MTKNGVSERRVGKMRVGEMRVGETRVGEMREVKRAYTSDPRHIHIHKIFMELDMGIDGTSFSSLICS